MTTQLTWYGHAALGLLSGGHQILVDPFFTGNPAASQKAADAQADFILVTHGHGDHLGDTVSIAKRCNALVISNFEIANWMKKQDVRAHGQHIGGGHQHPFGYLKLTQAMHGSALPDGSNGGNPAGFLLTTNDGQKIYLAGDTGLFGDMRLIGEEELDLAVIPIGDNFTMGPADALRAVQFLHPKHVIPIHYNTFDLIRQDALAWAEQVERSTDAKVHVLRPGDRFTLE
ncbi:predicted Zn-dependent hydrolase of the beta-lactamase fold [Longilinea arvoryzae]|uniref:UPF0173 metal-dependent hydrolase LARV_00550 n=1 Tax=Longilinea arvoryzae TaxID=360412 RepID=A0A0S7B750_9CHLR|nr:metal-dependent hydrolase [Longilinea arvoryzae]GAP12814.1 predicted Zn-dependent hydrolase of the beta-lactamase fold [Longilinea arvoryzae]